MNQVVGKTTTLSSLADRINAAQNHVTTSLKAALKYAVEAGQALNEARDLVPHGEWSKWLSANCEVSDRSARNYMRLARELPKLKPEERQRVAELPLREAMKMIAAAKPEVDCLNPPTGYYSFYEFPEEMMLFAQIYPAHESQGYFHILICGAFDGSEDGWFDYLKKPIRGDFVRDYLNSRFVGLSDREWSLRQGAAPIHQSSFAPMQTD